MQINKIFKIVLVFFTAALFAIGFKTNDMLNESEILLSQKNNELKVLNNELIKLKSKRHCGAKVLKRKITYKTVK